MASQERKPILQQIAGLIAAPNVARGLATLILVLAMSLLTVIWSAGLVPSWLGVGQAASPPLRLGKADVHAEVNGFELAVSITRMSNDCDAALNGNYCLRYSVLDEDEHPLQSGYGLIAPTTVQVHGATITLSVNSAAARGLHHLVGRGGPIAITWTLTSASPKTTIKGETTQLHLAAVSGNVIGYAIPSADAVAAVTFFAAA